MRISFKQSQVSSVSAVFLSMFATLLFAPADAQDLGCDALVPTRDSFLETDGATSVGASILSQRLASIEFDSGATFKYRERFPEFFSPNDIFEIERFYYMVCRALDTDQIEPERKFFLFLQAERERRESLNNAIIQTFESAEASQQIGIIEDANQLGGEYQRLANHRGIDSPSELVRGAAISNIIKSSSIIGGTVSPEQTDSVGSFSIRIGELNEIGGTLNFSGWFFGGIFDADGHHKDGIGSVNGDVFNFSNPTCTITARLQEDRRTLIDHINCTTGYRWGRVRPKYGEVVISLF